MLRDLVLKDTKKEEWNEIRQRIHDRIMETFNDAPVPLKPITNRYEIVDEYERYGLRHLKIRYHILDDEWNEAICVLPKDIEERKSAPGIITIHGTNGAIGKYGAVDVENAPRRAYAIELAQRGFVAISPDQYGFGSTIADISEWELTKQFYEKYPDWSIQSRRLLGHIRALDVLEQLSFVKKGGFGAIGNSLGGSAVLFLAAMDERVTASVVSCGISPKITNVYRILNAGRSAQPKVADIIGRNGRIPWDLHEMIALCAPRAVMCCEPFNDPYNPYPETTVSCILKATKVYELLEQPEKIAFYMHGDSHDTVDEVRRMAYDWLARFLTADTKK